MTQDTCRWFISDEQPECGEPAVTKVRLTGRIIKATIPVCSKHKKMHDSEYARDRVNKQ